MRKNILNAKNEKQAEKRSVLGRAIVLFQEHWGVRVVTIGMMCWLIAMLMAASNICFKQPYGTIIIVTLMIVFVISGARALYQFAGESTSLGVALGIICAIVCLLVGIGAFVVGSIGGDSNYTVYIDGKKYAAYGRTWHRTKVSIYKDKGAFLRGNTEICEVSEDYGECKEKGYRYIMNVVGGQDHIHVTFNRDYEKHIMTIETLNH